MISIIGTGTMGKGIAVEFAKFDTKIQLIIANRNSKASSISIKEELERIIDKFKYTNKEQILERIIICDKLQAVDNSKLVIEAITEDIDIKRDLLKDIKAHVRPDAVIASNTSSLSITEIFKDIFNFDRVVGLHFFNPVQVMKLVEISYTDDTSQSTIEHAKEVVKLLEKEYVIVKNSPGFIVNRLLIPMINEAAKILDEGIATAEDIDKAMKLGANHPIGPLKLSDLIGNDVTLSIVQILNSTISNEVSRGLVELVERKNLGRKTKIGFYEYSR